MVFLTAAHLNLLYLLLMDMDNCFMIPNHTADISFSPQPAAGCETTTCKAPDTETSLLFISVAPTSSHQTTLSFSTFRTLSLMPVCHWDRSLFSIFISRFCTEPVSLSMLQNPTVYLGLTKAPTWGLTTTGNVVSPVPFIYLNLFNKVELFLCIQPSFAYPVLGCGWLDPISPVTGQASGISRTGHQSVTGIRANMKSDKIKQYI